MDVTQLKNLARIAEAPPRDFQAWHASMVVNPFFDSPGAKVRVISYKVPNGYSLVLTELQSWISVPLTGASPGTPPPVVEDVLPWSSLFGYFSIDDDIITDEKAQYCALAKGGLLLVFPQAQCARYWLESGNTISPAQFSITFQFSGFLTLPEHAARLQAMQSVVPNLTELACP